MKTTLLFYNLYPKTNWEIVTKKLLSNVPHDEIVVHVSLPIFSFFKKNNISKELKKYPKINKIIFSKNDKALGETVGFERLKNEIDLHNYSILTYIHSKGTSKPRKNTQEIRDWTELMRYFVVEKLDLTKQAFDQGYYLSGVNIRDFGHTKVPNTPYHYSGNFVNINLDYLLEPLLHATYSKTYFGLEMFWGTICPREKAFSMHESNIKNHYEEKYPSSRYK